MLKLITFIIPHCRTRWGWKVPVSLNILPASGQRQSPVEFVDNGVIILALDFWPYIKLLYVPLEKYGDEILQCT